MAAKAPAKKPARRRSVRKRAPNRKPTAKPKEQTTQPVLRGDVAQQSHKRRVSSKAGNSRPDFVQTLVDRGFVYQATNIDGIRALASSEQLVGYIGFDATAPSLHVGSLVQIMMLRWLQKAGGKPIVVMGGGTTRIGDPSDKDNQRPILPSQRINAHKKKIQKVFRQFLDFDSSDNAAIMTDNAVWLGKRRLGLLQFLEDVGRHFTINKMITLESVRRRLDREQPLTFLEFNYPLLQAYDFVELCRTHGCRLQMGGSDQWGNILQGIDLARRVLDVECFGLTSPLITTSSGAKMGKTAQGAVWLSAEYRSPYEYWQFWRNTEDADVGRFLKLFTDAPLSEIARLEKLQGAEINEAKIVLANEATTMLHGADAARAAETAAKAAFTGAGSLDALPSVAVPSAEFAAGLRLTNALTRAGLTASNGEAKRLIEQGAVAVNDVVVSDAGKALGARDVKDGAIKLTRGKTRHALVKVV